MARLLILTPAELTRDPRARRAAVAGLDNGLDVLGLCIDGDSPAVLDGVPVTRIPVDSLTRRRSPSPSPALQEGFVRLEARGCFRVARLARTTTRLVRAGSRLGATVVHANDFETLPAAAWLARGRRARLVYDAHELYTRFEPRPPRCWAFLQRLLERALARRADTVLTVSPAIARRLRDLHDLREPPLVALNCPPITPAAVRLNADGGPLRVVYQAATGPNRIVSDLFGAVHLTTDVHVTVRIAGADPKHLRSEAATLGASDGVDVSEPVAPDRLVEALAPFDVGVVIDRRATENTELALPNKLFEYLMAGLAVVVPRLAAMAELVESEQVGLTYEPGDPADLARALDELAADRPRLEAMQRRARELAVTRYNAEAQVPVLLEAWGL